LFAPHGFSVAVRDDALVFADASPEAYVDAELADHPGWVEAHKLLDPLGKWNGVRADLTKLFADANEDLGAFRITSRYVVATVAA
jgi:hypothetical protein